MLCIKKLLTITLTAIFLLVSGLTAFASPIPDTGITKCYDDTKEIPCPKEGEPFYGQDGNYSINPMSYTKLDDNGNDLPITATSWAMVRDNVTGLIWENNSHESTWDNASNVIAELNNTNFGGYSDWRLPTMTELTSIVDYSIPTPGPTINANYFKDAITHFYWSSSTDASHIHDAWGVSFYSGHDSSTRKSSSQYVRAVRGGQSVIVGKLAIAQLPMSAPAGTTFVQWGTGFTQNSTATIHFQKPDGTEYDTTPQSIDEFGHFEIKYPSNWDKPAGTYTWWAVDGVTGETSNKVSYQITPLSNGYFNFSSIEEQKMNSQFTVDITAFGADGKQDTGFNGKVSLTSSLGSVKPTSVDFINGMASVSVTLYNQGKIQLKCSSDDGRFGGSTPFNVKGDEPCNGTIEGKVVDTANNNAAIWKAEIKLYDYKGEQVSDTYTTEQNGTFKFDELACGNYTLKVKKDDGSKEVSCEVSSSIPNRLPDIELSLDLEGFSGTPVIFIPGILGSSSYEMIWTVSPRLPEAMPAPASELDIFCPKHTGWKALEDYLERYTDKDKTIKFKVFKCPWDWRLTCEDNYKIYLREAVDKALKVSTTGKVHIVAHSTGGLITRAYIQSTDLYYGYRHDIDKFVMLGTPNLGSSNPYYMWEGGDTGLLDDIVDNLSLLFTYTDTIQALWEETYRKKGWNKYDHKAVREFIRDKGKSMLQLMNTQEFLTDGSGSWKTSGDNFNLWLDTLNSDPNIPDLMSIDGAGGKIKVKIFASTIHDTIQKVKTVKRSSIWFSNTLYEDGSPNLWSANKSAVWGQGDGTVPFESAKWPADQGWAQIDQWTADNSHSFLMGECKKEIYNFLTDKTGSTASSSRQSKTADDSEIQSPILSVSLTGDMRLLLTDPQGKRLGLDPVSGNFLEEIAGAKIVFSVHGGSVSIENPIDGDYAVTLSGTSERDFFMDAAYQNQDKTQSLRFKGYSGETAPSFNIIFNGTSEPFIKIIPLVQSPTGIKPELYSKNGTDLVRLTWNSAGQDISGYNVYSAGETEPYFTLLAALPSGTNKLDTTIPWSSNSDTPVITFAVTAVKADGSESFFSDMVQNNDRDHDGLSDEQETEIGTNMTKSDTDGDGLDDGKESAYGTNPTKTDTDGDTYSDYAEVQGQSDPLDSSSVPTTQTQTYKVLTDSSPSLSISSGENVKVYGSNGVNTLNISSGAKVECINFPGANVVNLVDDSPSDFTVRRSGAAVYFESSSKGTTIKIPATKTIQTLNFAGGVIYNLVISNGKVMLNSQELTLAAIQL